ncbi:MAG: right-handed parallel beta-helix repeat-containing protein [Bacteroidia bacterium]|nr:right-handed parallel beta-helix repeat-containing protein [Bacteroidia bacterium]
MIRYFLLTVAIALFSNGVFSQFYFLPNALPGDTIVVPPMKSDAVLDVTYQGTSLKPVVLIGRDVTLGQLRIINCRYLNVIGFTILDSEDNGLVVRLSEYVSFDSIQVINAKDNGVRVTEYSSRIFFNHCSVANSGVDNFTVHNSPQGPAGRGITFTNCFSTQSKGEQGFDITSGTDISLINCRASRNDDGPLNIGHGVSNVLVQNFYANQETEGPVVKYATNVKFVGGTYDHALRLEEQDSGPGQGFGADTIFIVNNAFPFIWNQVGTVIITTDYSAPSAKASPTIESLSEQNRAAMPRKPQEMKLD